MNKKIITDKIAGEGYTHAVHKSGLNVYVCEKRNFSGTYAIFGTKYGSVDNAFRKKGENDFVSVPNGIAHFLEHKLFESEDGDAFSRFAKTGASANAYTSFDKTCYLFTCTGNFDESFDILLDFVRHPYFTEETVKKEQGIIGQEIRMYDDSPEWMLLFNLLELLYHNNPVKINIAGTQKTISEISADLLYKCYNTFYNLNNMFIVVSGNCDTDSVLEKIDKTLEVGEAVNVERARYFEPEETVADKKEYEMEVAFKQFALGFKLHCDENEYLSAETVTETEMLLELIAGRQSRMFSLLLNEGLINKGFSPELMQGRGFAVEMFSSQSREPEKAVEIIKTELARLKKDGIDENDFKAVQRQFYGRAVMQFNDIESIGDTLTGCACTGEGLFDDLDIIRSCTPEKLMKRLLTQFDDKYSALSLIIPKGGEK